MTKMIGRVPRFAETKFANLCAEEDVLCHHTEEDENGWDYLVEFPPRPRAAPADTHPPPPSALVQVKSTRHDRLTCRVKLSNALRAAQSRQPWFFVLVIADARNTPTKIYAVHVWEEVIRQTLKAVRRSEKAKGALNQRQLTIRFDGADQRDDAVVSWMREAIEAVGPDYEQQKEKIFQTVGYEDGYGTGHIALSGATVDEILENFLGVGKGLPVSQFTFIPSRFGITSPEPAIDVSSAVIHIMPHPAGSCEIRFRGANASTPIVLFGQVYSPGIPDLPCEQRRLRFSAEFFEIFCWQNGRAVWRTTLEASEKTELACLEKFSTLMIWCDAGPVDMQIWSNDKRLLGGRLTVTPKEFDWPTVAKVVRVLHVVAGPADANKIRLSVEDLNSAAHELILFQWLLESPHVQFQLRGSPENKVSSLLYYSYVEVCEFTFYALIERPLREDIAIEERRRMTFGEAQILESYVIRNISEEERSMMNDDYERHLDQRKVVGMALGIGDVHVFLAAAAAASDI